jgi:hypothetical protein
MLYKKGAPLGVMNHSNKDGTSLAERRRDSHSGFRMELENLAGDAKGKRYKWKPHEAESTEAPARGALLRSSEETA